MTNFFSVINKTILIILIITAIYIYFDARNNNNSYLNSLFWALTAMFVEYTDPKVHLNRSF